MLQSPSAPVRPSLVMPVLAAIVAVAIFVVDTVTPLDIAIAVLYVAVVLLAMDFAGQRGILIVAAGCAALTVLSYVVTHNHDPASGPFLRGLISLVAIGITAALAARHQGTIEVLREHANLLDLTHDTIFVRNHDDVITYWNRAADRALRLAARAGGRPQGSRAPEDGVPHAVRGDHGRGRAQRTLGGRAGAHHARRTARDGGQPLGGAARRPRPAGGDPGDQQRHHRRSAPSRTACTAPAASLPTWRASPPWASSRPRSPMRSTSRWPPSSPMARPACAGWRARSPTSPRRAARSST